MPDRASSDAPVTLAQLQEVIAPLNAMPAHIVVMGQDFSAFKATVAVIDTRFEALKASIKLFETRLAALEALKHGSGGSTAASTAAAWYGFSTPTPRGRPRDDDIGSPFAPTAPPRKASRAASADSRASAPSGGIDFELGRGHVAYLVWFPYEMAKTDIEAVASETLDGQGIVPHDVRSQLITKGFRIGKRVALAFPTATACSNAISMSKAKHDSSSWTARSTSPCSSSPERPDAIRKRGWVLSKVWTTMAAHSLIQGTLHRFTLGPPARQVRKKGGSCGFPKLASTSRVSYLPPLMCSTVLRLDWLKQISVSWPTLCSRASVKGRRLGNPP